MKAQSTTPTRARQRARARAAAASMHRQTHRVCCERRVEIALNPKLNLEPQTSPQTHQVCCERRVEITHSNPQRLVQPARLVACTLAGIVLRRLRLPCSVISRAPAAQPDGTLLEREQGASAGRSGQGRKTARRVGEARDEAAEAHQEKEQEQAPRACLREHHAEGLHAKKQRRPALKRSKVLGRGAEFICWGPPLPKT
jgi:hypothetical protein